MYDRGLYSLNLTNNFIETDGVHALVELFTDPFKAASHNFNTPVPTSIRILVLDYNFLGRLGCDLLAQILSSSRTLLLLSI